MHYSRLIIFLCFLAVDLSFIGCSNEKKLNSATTTAADITDTIGIFTYYSREPVIPDHRSFTIKVTPLYSYLTVEDYEKVVLKDSILIPKAAYDSFATAIYHLHITNRTEKKGPPCIGGGLEQFTFYAGSSREVKGWITYCGDSPNGDLEGDLMAATKLFHAIYPDLYKKIDATIKEDD